MELRQVRYFVAVAEELHIGRAAERLFITQPPLTRQIKQLEEELQVTLFVRTPKGVELTTSGEAFLVDARILLKQTKRALSRAQLAHAGKLGRLDIGYYGSPILKAIPEILRVFHSRFPEVEVHLQHMEKRAQIEALKDKTIHLGFSRSIPETPGIETILVYREPLLLAVSKDLPFPAVDEVSIEDLITTPMILFPTLTPPSFADEVVNLCKGAGFHPNVAAEAEDAETCIALVAAGFGAALVPESVSSLRIEGIRYLPLVPNQITTNLQCIYSQFNRAPILDSFIEIIKGYQTSQR